ncbi:MAG: phosphatidate cytidylyltransferase, partial [Atopobium sp.]|nr:phosphatidate cytidylyltransferase [Atopobium sp.]
MVDNTRDSKKPTSRIDADSQLNPEETGSVGIDRQIEKLEIRRSLKELQ